MPEWRVEKHEDYVSFISPEGFRFEFNNYSALFKTLDCILNQEDLVYCRHNERLRLGGHGSVWVVDCDPWINRTFELGSIAAKSAELAKIILNYLMETYIANSDSKLPELPR